VLQLFLGVVDFMILIAIAWREENLIVSSSPHFVKIEETAVLGAARCREKQGIA
jgi:hypothetical protein